MFDVLYPSSTNITTGPLSDTLGFIWSIPNPLNSGMGVVPKTLNTVSWASKNLFFANQARNAGTAANGNRLQNHNRMFMLTGIACDILHSALYLNDSALEKAKSFGKVFSLDVARIVLLAMTEKVTTLPISAVSQTILALGEMAFQTELNYHNFQDDPSKTGNLYRAISANDPRLVHEWSKSPSFDINAMGEGGPAGTVPALFIAAKVPDINVQVFKNLIANGADPQAEFTDPESSYTKFTILEYVETVLSGREDLVNCLKDSIRDAGVAESAEESAEESSRMIGSSKDSEAPHSEL